MTEKHGARLIARTFETAASAGQRIGHDRRVFAGGELYLNGSFGELQTGVIGIDGGAEAILPIGDTLTTANIMRAWEAWSPNFASITDGCTRDRPETAGSREPIAGTSTGR
ncbi:hypothetical protein [Bradyrhizobium sp. cir1]|uniref:hypothetical protein n=1 Tax=Bradyrhizobium sp. cir1 TaxID=1445730 RepID=UPI001605FFB7|nr:hypothetical protein [Bradyrhizobium sp. cir1]